MEKILVFGHQKPDTDTVTSAIVLSYLKIGLFGLIIAISINVVAVTLYDLLRVRFHLNKAC